VEGGGLRAPEEEKWTYSRIGQLACLHQLRQFFFGVRIIFLLKLLFRELFDWSLAPGASRATAWRWGTTARKGRTA
jgi:hypothetical protein